MSDKCPNCRRRFSDWFVWNDGNRHCFPCWTESGFVRTFLETNEVIELQPVEWIEVRLPIGAAP